MDYGVLSPRQCDIVELVIFGQSTHAGIGSTAPATEYSISAELSGRDYPHEALIGMVLDELRELVQLGFIGLRDGEWCFVGGPISKFFEYKYVHN